MSNNILRRIDMEDKEYIGSVCCEYCKHFEKKTCPIKSADNWSRWDYCNHFRSFIHNRTIPEILKAKK